MKTTQLLKLYITKSGSDLVGSIATAVHDMSPRAAQGNNGRMHRDLYKSNPIIWRYFHLDHDPSGNVASYLDLAAQPDHHKDVLLLVEEGNVRDHMTSSLESLGCVVTCAKPTREALKHRDRSVYHYAVINCDVAPHELKRIVAMLRGRRSHTRSKYLIGITKTLCHSSHKVADYTLLDAVVEVPPSLGLLRVLFLVL
jgi:hypothetical protein